MQRFFLTIFIWIIGFSIKAQLSVSGYITDSITGEALINAHIYCPEFDRGTYSNAFGYFYLLVDSSDTSYLKISYTGYLEKRLRLSILEDMLLYVALKQGVSLAEVRVSADLRIEDKTEISTLKLSMNEVSQLPALGGEVDLIKALQLLPGVNQGSEGSSGLYVRGGSPDQNLVLLDDVPLYYVNHLGGLVSTFNTDAISNVSLIKGGFPARYGSRLSSVLDVRMKNGNVKEFSGNATFGVITSKVLFEGPIKKDTSSYLVSIRRMMYDIISRPLTPLLFNGISLGYNFYDVNAKYTHKLNEKNRLYLSFYSGDDRATGNYKNSDDDINATNKLRWGNALFSSRWNHVFTPKLFHNLTVYHTRYRNKISQTYSGNEIVSEYNFLSQVSDIGVRSDYDFFLSETYTMRLGTSAIYHRYKPTQIKTQQKLNGIKNDSISIDFSESAFETSFYLENDFKLGSRLGVNAGLHFNIYNTNGQNFSSLQPRLSLNYRFIEKHSLKLGYAQMQQNIHLLVGEGTGMPTDYWLPATKILPPQFSSQYSAGWYHTTFNKKFEISIEAYYKGMRNLITFEEGQSYFTGLDNWQNQVVSSGKGVSKGLELFIKKKTGFTTGWIGYTLSKTTRQFDSLNNGITYPFRYDRRHDLSLVIQHHLSDKIYFFATWVFNTGNALTLSNGQYVIPHEKRYSFDEPHLKVEIYGSKNSNRMESYHRMDVGMNLTSKNKNGQKVWRFSIYNLYNKQNAYFYFWDNIDCKYDEKCMPKLYKQILFPIIPSVSYSFSF